MPIYVQWKWIDKTQTYLLILHFDSDGSKPNLRNKSMVFRKYANNNWYQIYSPTKPPTNLCEKEDEAQKDFEKEVKEGKIIVRDRIVTTWAPTHIENGLLSEILSYANRINGLKPQIRQELRPKIAIGSNVLEYVKRARFGEIADDDEELMKNQLDTYSNLISLVKLTGDEPCLLGCDYNFKEEKCESIFCTALTENYIEYLKTLIKPYS